MCRSQYSMVGTHRNLIFTPHSLISGGTGWREMPELLFQWFISPTAANFLNSHEPQGRAQSPSPLVVESCQDVKPVFMTLFTFYVSLKREPVTWKFEQRPHILWVSPSQWMSTVKWPTAGRQGTLIVTLAWELLTGLAEFFLRAELRSLPFFFSFSPSSFCLLPRIRLAPCSDKNTFTTTQLKCFRHLHYAVYYNI